MRGMNKKKIYIIYILYIKYIVYLIFWPIFFVKIVLIRFHPVISNF